MGVVYSDNFIIFAQMNNEKFRESFLYKDYFSNFITKQKGKV